MPSARPSGPSATCGTVTALGLCSVAASVPEACHIFAKNLLTPIGQKAGPFRLLGVLPVEMITSPRKASLQGFVVA